MDKLLSGVLTTPVATIFIIAGIIFLFIAVIGNISGKIEPGIKSRVLSGILGLVFIFSGLTMHFKEEGQTEQLSKIDNDKITVNETLEAPQKVTKPKEIQVTDKLVTMPTVVLDKEPNDHVTTANLIVIGTTIRGTISTKKDRDIYKFKALSSKTRVILRKLSLPGFAVAVDIYDSVEYEITSDYERGDKPVTFSFESNTGSTYYVLVKSLNYKYRGDYELVIRNE